MLTPQDTFRSANTRGPLPTDEDIRHAATLDKDYAMSLVVKRHRSRLKRRATQILRDPDLAGDVCQEVFIRAMREPRFFDADFRQGAWLYRVASNLCLNMVRDKRRRTAILETVPTPRTQSADQLDHVFADQQHETMLEAMSELSSSHRAILMERFYNDLSYAEIAEVLDLKLGTVMSRLSRAKKRLLALLDGSPLTTELNGQEGL
ncbi:MAG: RNA polymerase sigma factor [Myxococcota bacterium]